jgi:hypothetical protein
MLVPRAFVALIRDVKPVASESLTVDDKHLADRRVNHEVSSSSGLRNSKRLHQLRHAFNHDG